MSRFVTIPRKLVAVFITLLVGILVITLLPLLYKDQIHDLIKVQFGQRSDQILQDFQTDISLIRQFPDMGITFRNISIVDTNGIQPLEVLGIQKATFQVDLLALVDNKIKVNKATLDGLVFHQRIDSLGNRFGFRLKRESDQPAASPGISIPEIIIRQAKILIENEYKKNSVELAVHQAQIGAGINGDSITLAGTILGEIHHIGNKNLLLFRKEPFTGQGRYTYYLGQKTGTLAQSHFTVNDSPISICGSHTTLTDSEGSLLDFQISGTQPLQDILQALIPDTLQASLGNMESTSALTFQYHISGKSSPILRPENDLSFSIEDGLVQWPGMQAKISHIQLVGEVNKDKVQLKQLDFDAFGGRFTSKGIIDLHATGQYPVYIQAKIHQMNLKRMAYLAEKFNLDVLGSQNIRGKIDCSVVLHSELDKSFLPDISKTLAYTKAVIRNLELIEVQPIQKALHPLSEERTGHIYFEDVHADFVFHKKRFITSGTNLHNNISYFDLYGTYTMGADADLYFDISLLDILFGNNTRRIERIQKKQGRKKEKAIKQHVFLRREQGEYQVKLFQKKYNKLARLKLENEIQRLLTRQKVDTTFALLDENKE